MGNRAVIAFVNDKGEQDKTALEFTYIGTEVETAWRVLQAAKDYGLRLDLMALLD